MEYILSFLEGILTFISPCFLPMIPIYILYLAGDKESAEQKSKVFINSLGFICGFSIVFILLGAFAGTLGAFISKWQTSLNVVTGILVILFGLHYLGVFAKFLPSRRRSERQVKVKGFLSSVLFGMIFSVSWTPCVGAFLGSALMLASAKGTALTGMLMLLCYSAGLGIPFLISALLIGKMQVLFGFIKKNYNVIIKISGGFLVFTGILMATGYLGYFIRLLAW